MIAIDATNHDKDYGSALDGVLRDRTYAMIYLHGGKAVNLEGTTVSLRQDHLVVTDPRASSIVVVRYDQILMVEASIDR